MNEKRTNEELVKAIQIKRANGDDTRAEMMDLYSQNEGFIVKMASTMALHTDLDFEDLKQEAYIALDKAVTEYESDKGILFISFFGNWLKSYLGLARDNFSFLPNLICRGIRRYNQILKDYETKYGREPNAQELYEAMNSNKAVYTHERIKRIRYFAEHPNISLDCCINDDGDSLCNTIGRTEQAFDKIIDDKFINQLSAEIEDIINKELTADQRNIFRLLYQQEYTQSDIARHLSITKQAVSARKIAIMQKLQREKVKARLLPYYLECEEIMAGAYRGSAGSFARTRTSATERTALRLIDKLHT